MDEEKRRLQSTREEVGDNSGGKRIDLESGKVRINKAEDDDATGSVDPKAESATEPKRGRKKLRRADRDEDGKPSEAAIRAAKRRGRTL